jgi:hypothetical protein
VPRQAHFEFMVADVEDAVGRLRTLGATREDRQDSTTRTWSSDAIPPVARSASSAAAPPGAVEAAARSRAAYATVTTVAVVVDGAAAVTHLIGHDHPAAMTDMKRLPRSWNTLPPRWMTPARARLGRSARGDSRANGSTPATGRRVPSPP